MKTIPLQTLLIGIAFVGVAAFALADRSSALTSLANLSYRDTTPIIRDADTIIVRGTPVRLFGIDAPDDDQSLSDAATKYIGQMIISQGGVTCSGALIERVTGGKACAKPARSYDRINMICRFNASQTSVGATLVAHGYAVDYRLFSGGLYQTLMKGAAAQRRGLWRDRYDDMRVLANHRSTLPARCIN
jgi:micrococcal nuclease